MTGEELHGLQVHRRHSDRTENTFQYKHYRHLTDMKKKLDEDEWKLLQFLAVHVSVMYTQLNFFFRGRWTRNKLDKMLGTLEYFSLIECWHAEFPQSRPEWGGKQTAKFFTLSDEGYRLIKYWHGKLYVHAPELLDKAGKYIHLRYWRDIDFICLLRQQPAYLDHMMHPQTDGELRHASFAYRLKPSDREFNFLVHSTLENDTLDKMRGRMKRWDAFMETGQPIIIEGYPMNPTFMLLYIQTRKQAEKVNRELLLDLKKGNIVICVGEVLYEQGLRYAFFKPLAEGELQQVEMKFFS